MLRDLLFSWGKRKKKNFLIKWEDISDKQHI